MLGPYYLPFLVHELHQGLSRGYQLHVLGYTVHAVLRGIQPQCADGTLEDGLEEMMDIFINDVFGDVAEEKEVCQGKGRRP